MTYVKPELVSMADARIAIQSDDGSGSHKESPVQEIGNLTASTGAYEADE